MAKKETVKETIEIVQQLDKESYNNYLETGTLSQKKDTAFFPTPRNLVEDMFIYSSFDSIIGLEKEYQSRFRVLEPSAGVAGIADPIRQNAPHVKIDTVEILDINQNILKSKGYDPYCMDFMDFNKDYSIKYDYILMNPPFKGTLYLKHIFHAYNMLEENDGSLCAIIPLGFKNNDTKLAREFRELLGLCGEVYMNEEKSFEGSGTNIATCTIVLHKYHNKWRLKEYQGHKNYYVWYNFLHITNVNEYYKDVMKLRKKKDFKEQYRDMMKELNLDYINKLKKDLIFIPEHYIEDYTNTMIEYAIDTYSNEELNFDFINKKEIETHINIASKEDTKINKTQNKEIEILPVYTHSQLNTFKTGSLF